MFDLVTWPPQKIRFGPLLPAVWTGSCPGRYHRIHSPVYFWSTVKFNDGEANATICLVNFVAAVCSHPFPVSLKMLVCTKQLFKYIVSVWFGPDLNPFQHYWDEPENLQRAKPHFPAFMLDLAHTLVAESEQIPADRFQKFGGKPSQRSGGGYASDKRNSFIYWELFCCRGLDEKIYITVLYPSTDIGKVRLLHGAQRIQKSNTHLRQQTQKYLLPYHQTAKQLISLRLRTHRYV